jgi:hypothetical protein
VLDVLSEGLIGPLPVVMEVPRVTWVGVGTVELVDEDQTEIALVADAARLEQLEPSSGHA